MMSQFRHSIIGQGFLRMIPSESPADGSDQGPLIFTTLEATAWLPCPALRKRAAQQLETERGSEADRESGKIASAGRAGAIHGVPEREV